jgi:EmrB/QacA subfamily drug resistance transporter
VSRDRRDSRDADTAIEAPGAEEISVLPWPLLVRRKVAERVASSDRFRWWVAWTVLAGLFSVGFTITILSVSLPRIADDLGSDVSTLTWVITGPLLAFGVLGPALGKAGDIWGQKRIYVVGLTGAAVFAALTALAWNASSLIVFRVLGAAEGAATGPASMALILRAFPPDERVKAMGYWSLVGAGAPVLGVVAGGPIVEHFSWRWIFVAQAPLTLVAVGIAMLVLPDTGPGERRPLDVAGAAALSVAATSLLFGLNRGPAWGWSSVSVVAGFVLSPLAVAAFVLIEQRAPHPLIDLSYVRRRNFSFPIANQVFTNFAYMGSFIMTPLLLKDAFGYGETHVGLLTIARPLSFSITAPLAGYLTVRVGERVSGIVGSLAVVASMIALSSLSPVTSSDLQVVLALALAGVGLGVSSPAMAASMANSVDEESLGIAGAAQQLLVQVGLVAGIQLAQTVQATTEGSSGLVESFGNAYLMLGAVSVIGVFCAAFVHRSPRDRGETPARDRALADAPPTRLHPAG